MGGIAVTDGEWQASIQALLELGRVDEALDTVYRATGETRAPAQFAQLLKLLEQFPAAAQAKPQWVRGQLRLLGNLGRLEDLGKQTAHWLAAGAGKDWTFLSVFMAWQAAEQGDDALSLKYGQAAYAAQQADLTPFERALLLRVLGRVKFRQGQAGWEDHFEQALAEGTGRARVLTLLEYGAILSHTTQTATTIRILSEAQALAAQARDDQLRMNASELLGRAYLRAGEFTEADKHLSTLEKLARRKDNRHLLSYALHCLAIPRRTLGEWVQAEALYSEALKCAGEMGNEFEQRQALRGLGHTRRLSGRALGALEVLEQAARVVKEDRDTGKSVVNVDIAAALVSLPHLDSAAVLDRLGKAGRLSEEGLQRAELVRAELDRRQGNAAAALERLAALDRGQLWLREEAHAFPELFALLPAGERPLPLPRPQRPLVRLEAMGFPKVLVNGRMVSSSALAVVVLAALLHEGPQLSTDRLTEVLDDGKPRTRRQAEQRLSKTVGTLRAALGWAGSIETGPGFYALDSGTDWQFDVAEALSSGAAIPAFLPGLDFPWVTDTEQRLSLGDLDI
ncbi:tetratricopeptide TPR_2 (plasmid) [Deinococcus proteolyticus MRP]|uniref:Tetratricopeptide TPR_2 n=1 Tax=Deinococcus proteolyticus (strain ATCC 35074 / DSM 20540 / JCM 6276 / NBRC 101906 / NCIMB 13154 / VKM Ac-1939 / CCM 2703 / MRP) TaxID=693977 RepID=F0RQW5_DEIPM|nr:MULTISPECIES: tetratricopeptide TPR_2 [Deinococcus]ADY27674.1 tetratricopeptide TPR_2 [Deinococcus proteolyticus MRP]MCY1703553.1 hypothetical protein [Deinococcus sp. SL84]